MMNKIATDIVVNKAIKDVKDGQFMGREDSGDFIEQNKNQSFEESMDSEEEEILRSMKERMGEAVGQAGSLSQNFQRKTVVQINEKEFFDLVKNNKD